jgi:hypothetical protein
METANAANRPDDGGSKRLWNVGKFLPDSTAQQHRRQPSSCWSPWEPQISPLILVIVTSTITRTVTTTTTATTITTTTNMTSAYTSVTSVKIIGTDVKRRNFTRRRKAQSGTAERSRNQCVERSGKWLLESEIPSLEFSLTELLCNSILVLFCCFGVYMVCFIDVLF